MMQIQSGTQFLLRQFLELCSSHSIDPTPGQLEALARKVEGYQACCRCYGWEESLRGLLLFYQQIDAGIRQGAVDEPTDIRYIKQKHPSYSPRKA